MATINRTVKEYNGDKKVFKKLLEKNLKLKAELEAIDKAGEHARQQINDAFRSKKPYWELEQENNKLLDVINNQDVKIADLEKQIEKMKCCWNCKYGENKEGKEPCSSCNKNWGNKRLFKKITDKWELEE